MTFECKNDNKKMIDYNQFRYFLEKKDRKRKKLEINKIIYDRSRRVSLQLNKHVPFRECSILTCRR